MVIWDYSFGGFSPWSVDPVALGSLVRQNITLRNVW